MLQSCRTRRKILLKTFSFVSFVRDAGVTNLSIIRYYLTKEWKYFFCQQIEILRTFNRRHAEKQEKHHSNIFLLFFFFIRLESESRNILHISRFFISRTNFYTQFYNFIHKSWAFKAQHHPTSGSQTSAHSEKLSLSHDAIFLQKGYIFVRLETVAGKPLKCLDVYEERSCGSSYRNGLLEDYISLTVLKGYNGYTNVIKVETDMTTGLFTQVLRSRSLRME